MAVAGLEGNAFDVEVATDLTPPELISVVKLLGVEVDDGRTPFKLSSVVDLDTVEFPLVVLATVELLFDNATLVPWLEIIVLGPPKGNVNETVDSPEVVSESNTEVPACGC